MSGSHALWGVLEERNIKRIVLVRHANATRPDLAHDKGGPMKAKAEYATPHDWKEADQMRPITEKGKEQCEAARGWFVSTGLNRGAALVASGARRAVETLQLMGEQREGGQAEISIVMCTSLHPAGIAPKMEELFDTIGYGALQKYHDAPDGATAAADYAELVCAELADVLRPLGPAAGDIDTVSIFGHAVFLNAVARNCAYWLRVSEADMTRLMSIDLGETEGFLLEKGDGGKPGTMQHMVA